MVETVRPQLTIQCGADKMRVGYWVAWARIETHTHNIQYLLLHCSLHWSTKFNLLFFVPRTSIDELSSNFYTEFRYLYRISFYQAGFQRYTGI